MSNRVILSYTQGTIIFCTPMTENQHILLVDDDNETREIYVELFRKAGFSVDEAGNGLEAMEKINEKKPDLIITGIIMPQMDGFMLVEALRKNVVTSSIPIIFLSHLGRQEDEERSREMGVNDFIVRGITPLPEVLSHAKMLLSTTEYLVAIDPTSYDGRRFALDLGLPENFMCTTGEGTQYVLRVKVLDAPRKQLSAEIICA